MLPDVHSCHDLLWCSYIITNAGLRVEGWGKDSRLMAEILHHLLTDGSRVR